MLTYALQSGSNGNAVYVEAGGVRLLFDAGISGRQARLRMGIYGHDVRQVDALILSHGHADHTRCAGVFQRLFDLPVYATPGTLRMIARTSGAPTKVHTFRPGESLDFGAVAVHTLATPHDAAESVAFVIEHAGQRLGLLTDLGHPFAGLAEILTTLDAAYLESNYDVEMLANGSYPLELQARIRGAAGHLSNDEAAELLRGFGGGLRWAALAHLSGENNNPELAMRTHRALLGARYPLTIAGRYGVSELLRL